MQNRQPATEALRVQGVPVIINWGALGVGQSFFVPVPSATIRSVKATLHWMAARRKYWTVTEEVAEKGLMGVRVWRIK